MTRTRLRDLGFTGPIDANGNPERPYGTLAEDRALTQALTTLLDKLRDPTVVSPEYYVATYEGDVLVGVQLLETKKALDQTLENGDGVQWGLLPPRDQLTVLPTPASVCAFPSFWISGPGREVAELVDCGHGYHLTDSCPNCGADPFAGQPESIADGELREQAREDNERRAAEKGRALLAVVLGPTPTERRQETLKAALETAYETAQQEQVDVRHAFVRDIQGLGPVRATSLWARKAMAWETRVSVWGHGVDLGNAGGDWSAAVDASEQMAVRLLKESVTPTRNAVDKALREVQGRAAAELLDTIESFRATVDR